MRLDAEALARDRVLPGEVCEIAGTGPIPLEAAIGLLAHGSVDIVLHHGRRVGNVTCAGLRLRRHLQLGPATERPPHRTRILLRIDTASLAVGTDNGAHSAEIAGVGLVDRSRLLGLLPERAVELVTTTGVDPRSIQIVGRRYPRPLEVAFREEHPFCVDCGASLWIERDHERPVALDGATMLDNLTGRCPRCHRTKTRAEAARTIRAGIDRARDHRIACRAPPVPSFT